MKELKIKEVDHYYLVEELPIDLDGREPVQSGSSEAQYLNKVDYSKLKSHYRLKLYNVNKNEEIINLFKCKKFNSYYYNDFYSGECYRITESEYTTLVGCIDKINQYNKLNEYMTQDIISRSNDIVERLRSEIPHNISVDTYNGCFRLPRLVIRFAVDNNYYHLDENISFKFDPIIDTFDRIKSRVDELIKSFYLTESMITKSL